MNQNNIEPWEEKLDALWDLYCLQGNEINPTDTMYYEQFMTAARVLLADKEREVREEYNSKGIYVPPFLRANIDEGLTPSNKE